MSWDEGPDGPQVIHCSLPFSTDGVSVEQTWDTLGMRSTGSHTVVLDDVFVPTSAVSLIRSATAWHPIWNTVTLTRKAIASDARIDAVRLAIEATGGVGYGRRSEIERLYRDVHGCLCHPLPRAKQTRLTGRAALGFDLFG